MVRTGQPLCSSVWNRRLCSMVISQRGFRNSKMGTLFIVGVATKRALDDQNQLSKIAQRQKDFKSNLSTSLELVKLMGPHVVDLNVSTLTLGKYYFEKCCFVFFKLYCQINPRSEQTTPKDVKVSDQWMSTYTDQFHAKVHPHNPCTILIVLD